MKTEKINFDNLTAEQIGKLFPIQIVPYDPDWEKLFDSEKSLIIRLITPRWGLWLFVYRFVGRCPALLISGLSALSYPFILLNSFIKMFFTFLNTFFAIFYLNRQPPHQRSVVSVL